MSQPDHDRGETDVESDPHVAASRASRDEDGSYVGRKATEDDFDSGPTGAERRATED